MKYVVLVTVGIAVYVALTAAVAALFAGALGVFAARCGLPPLTWWQSFCLLVCVACLGSSFGYVGAIAKRSS